MVLGSLAPTEITELCWECMGVSGLLRGLLSIALSTSPVRLFLLLASRKILTDCQCFLCRAVTAWAAWVLYIDFDRKLLTTLDLQQAMDPHSILFGHNTGDKSQCLHNTIISLFYPPYHCTVCCKTFTWQALR